MSKLEQWNLLGLTTHSLCTQHLVSCYVIRGQKFSWHLDKSPDELSIVEVKKTFSSILIHNNFHEPFWNNITQICYLNFSNRRRVPFSKTVVL